ncbi:DUF2303 family protein [Azospirillum sp. Sh1]|uniref:DUF2303 family protein n=1 Tax=Azospirillum sp. Sh1 TaxID=2607285 RepID=UPI0011EDB606|nr:DUF2303 family protein [Azospirillum sp. Sh1]KAA0571104.1 DUF2303 family protein [Azospirillum sp. Sh1]
MEPTAIPDGTAILIDTLRGLTQAERIPLDTLGTAPAALVLPKDKKLESLKPLFDAFRTAPQRIEQTVTLGTADSFIAYVSRFKTPSTSVFVDANPAKPSMVAAIDWHGVHRDWPGASPDTGKPALDTSPSFITHKAKHQFPLSDELVAWLKAMNGDPMKQEDFAFFLQERERDIENPPVDWMCVDEDTVKGVMLALNLVDDKGPRDDAGNYVMPDPAEYGEDEVSEEPEDTRYMPRSALYKLRKIKFAHAEQMMRLAAGIEVEQSTSVKQAFDPKSGKRTLMFKDDNDTRMDGRKVTIPDMFFINIPVFDGGARHLLPVRLYFRIKGTQVVWMVEVVDIRRMIRHAVETVATRVQTETGTHVYCGVAGL